MSAPLRERVGQMRRVLGLREAEQRCAELHLLRARADLQACAREVERCTAEITACLAGANEVLHEGDLLLWRALQSRAQALARTRAALDARRTRQSAACAAAMEALRRCERESERAETLCDRLRSAEINVAARQTQAELDDRFAARRHWAGASVQQV